MLFGFVEKLFNICLLNVYLLKIKVYEINDFYIVIIIIKSWWNKRCMDEYLSFFYIGDLVINVYLFGFCIFFVFVFVWSIKWN